MQLVIIFAALFQLVIGTPIDATGTSNSPGAVSGNVVQLPLLVPVNACGNSINVIGAGNAAAGNNNMVANHHIKDHIFTSSMEGRS
ncbi:hypothetical protein CONCODRAFT_12376 [Conidiobolus coronatus NRRL 28638]|uniref:Chaplin domain-containing protein n=1 Tax=Conidiobolus coronatus (strain ATCC 28846 / CBS 209.66 / NRRL 28638) TaxID=796925 RepID=A0A137NSZ7_CONC2|nr:hypothetical protein CONCODRAFT_12376 [Conidiobolus coronatus NRRL 28638]|eukprot:KXN65915.1 hypothetical protein CONCODRAFT_12376 [Conidiobolus coronatus NRRL 28638]